MNLICDASLCKNNVNCQCTLENISLNFNYDLEGYGATCSSFEESFEYQKSSYELHKLEKDVYLAINRRVLESVSIEALLKEIDAKEQTMVIIDNLIGNITPREASRFIVFEYNPSLNSKNILEGVSENIKISKSIDEKYDKVVRKLTCDLIRKNKNHGFLLEQYKDMILNGINL